jgi:iron(II)-dependent oxidoreductase
MLDELNELATFADVLLTPPRPSDRELAAWPVFNVTWAEAERYCESLGKRLPTEAEWEKAARGDKGSLYPWGETAPDATRAVFGRRERNALPPVSAVDSPLGGRSPYGLRHMAGNLAEWVRDWFYAVQYAAMPERNPKGPENGFEKVVRGGSWQSAAHELRTAARASAPPGLRSPTIGFRCAKATRRAR